MSSPKHTNFDSAELQKFSLLASKWWDPNSEFRPLHEINPLRLNWIDERVSLKGKQVLDVGCGGGILAESMALRGANVLGIDLAEKSLNVAELHQLDTGVTNLSYRLVAAEQLATQQAEQYDVVTCLEMLEHVPNPELTVKACAELCKPGGWVFFSTLNRNPKSFLFAIVGAEYVLQLLPKGTHSYSKFIKPSELAQHTRQAGLETSDIIGLVYNPLTKVYRLARDTDVNYMIACRKPI
jgi:2-polyprenyl-6-hydroxyphenyl methylase / 3-demethylubiquinone-9 3-methyltransferase